MTSIGAWEIGPDDVPLRISRDRDFLEKHLENWIERDPSLISSYVRWVSRQLTLPDGSRLDLLGLSGDGSWVIVELKPDPPGAGAVDQVLHYFMQIASMTDGELAQRIKSHGLSDSATLEALEALTPDAGDAERSYRLIVAGVGTGDAARTAAEALTRHGFDVPIQVVTFEVLGDSAGRRLLVRDVEEAVYDDRAAASRRSLEDVVDIAERCGVRDGFQEIRSFLLGHGYREQRRGTGLNFNLGSRLQCFWVRPAEGAVRIGYLDTNFPALFGVDESEAHSDLGENWIDLPPAQALERIRQWVVVIDGYRGGAGEPATSS
jgi:hypothetical protein